LSRRLLLALCALLIASAVARADEDTIDMNRAVFVAVEGSPVIPFIDPDTNRIAGSIDAGLVPRQIELASSIEKLLAIDGISARVNIVDLVSGAVRTVPLAFIPGRVTVSGDGLTAAVADHGSGQLVLVDLLRHQILGTVGDLSPLHDMVFSSDGRTLYVAGEHQGFVDVIDVATVHLQQPIATGLPHGSLSLSRAPNGKRLFVQPDDGGGVGVIDLEHGSPLPVIQAGPASTIAFPSASGAYLLIADNQVGTLAVIRDGDVPRTTVLQAATGVGTIYTAWFDTLALVPSSTTRALLLYDLDATRPAGSIALGAEPARGAITPDGQKLFLPLPAAGTVAVIDARNRVLAASITVKGHPTSVVLAGSYGICH
jgi:DNA-binding beta-propeller fold protein YncE